MNHDQKKRIKGQTTIYKTLHMKPKIPTKKRRWNQELRKDSSSWFTSGTRRVTILTNPVIKHGWGKDLKVVTSSVAYSWTYMFRSD